MATAEAPLTTPGFCSNLFSSQSRLIACLHCAALLLLCSCILFINIGGWELYNPDEPRYAQVARKMLDTGNYIVPRLGAELIIVIALFTVCESSR
jgi:hypothetical protein